MRKCSLKGCGNNYYAKKFCRKHYDVNRIYGNPLASREKREFHGMHKKKEYKIWKRMRTRCLSENNPKYKDYGGRGIKICERWDLFSNFYEDMGDCPSGYSIDRIDVNGNYEPDNCRWADSTIQARNQRIKSNNTSGYKGITWVKHLGKWQARITIYKKEINLGYFKDKKLAIMNRKLAETYYNFYG